MNIDKFKDLGITLATLRKKKKKNQRKLAELLTERGITVTNQAISKWETGAALPNAVQFLNLCDILGVEDVMSCFSDGHTGFLSGLNADGRKMALELIQVFGESEKYSQAS